MKIGYSPGKLLRTAVEMEKPLQVVGVPNAYTAVMAEKSGFLALYLSGAGVANGAFALPDLGMTTMVEVLEEVRRITGASLLPLLVDCDTGFGGNLMVGRTVREMIRAGAAGMHLEDQVPVKRCGHRPNKSLVSTAEMVDRIKAAVDARSDPDFVIMARTDAFAVEGLQSAIDRAGRYRDAGADMIFPEALTATEHYRFFADMLGVPILANQTEFGLTPLFGLRELAEAEVSLVLYPLSAFRAMNAAALSAFQTIRMDGTQKGLLDSMQSRAELYDFLGYLEYERKIDKEPPEEDH
ncbi:MAG: methylisocitrate lyase [Deltaproteobacteria bacterium]|nr:methylisocitrate lyase [Deltaproteobacteria bacterium]TLN03305.1 MAG: methylisocitrate lyase [bacterium]